MANSIILLRVEPGLKRQIEKCAAANERTLSQEVRRVLKREFRTRETASEEGSR